MVCVNPKTIMGRSVKPLTKYDQYIKTDKTIYKEGTTPQEIDKKTDFISSKLSSLKFQPIMKKLKPIKISF